MVNSAAKTRHVLEMQGILLRGPLVPEWFKLQSDGCSVPTGFLRKVLKSSQTRAACYIHDFEYYLINICYQPNTLESRNARQMADVSLRWNRTRIGRNWLSGQVFGRWYYRGVRLGGKRALNKKHGTLVTPPSMKSVDEIREHCIELCDGALTKTAKKRLAKWQNELENNS